ncbi:MAG: hypothetical protein V4558_13775 [Gemmatimonadota bacterium]
MSSRRESFRVPLVLVVFGLLGLANVLTRPTIATIRPVDVVRLIGTGMFLGAAIVALVWARAESSGTRQ